VEIFNYFLANKKCACLAKICALYSIFPKEDIIFAFTFEKSSLP